LNWLAVSLLNRWEIAGWAFDFFCHFKTFLGALRPWSLVQNASRLAKVKRNLPPFLEGDYLVETRGVYLPC